MRTSCSGSASRLTQNCVGLRAYSSIPLRRSTRPHMYIFVFHSCPQHLNTLYFPHLHSLTLLLPLVRGHLSLFSLSFLSMSEDGTNSSLTFLGTAGVPADMILQKVSRPKLGVCNRLDQDLRISVEVRDLREIRFNVRNNEQIVFFSFLIFCSSSYIFRIHFLNEEIVINHSRHGQ